MVGAGPAGAAAVRELLRRGARVLWFDAGEPRSSWAESLANLPDLPELTTLACTGYRSCWGSDEVEERDTLRQLSGPGHLVDREQFDRALVRATGVQPTIRRLGHLERSAQGWDIEGQTADFLIDASGRAGGPARRLGGPRTHLDRQVAVQIHGASDDLDQTVVTEATPDGWWYSLRCPTGRTVGFVTQPELSLFQHARTPAGFAELAAQTRLIPAPPAITPTVRLAGTSRLERFAGPGWAAAGDAALALDPLGSRGLWLALESGRRAAQAAWGETDYIRWLEQHFFGFLAEREAVYAAETRWPTSPYWKQRRL